MQHTYTHPNFRLPAADIDREVTNQVPGPKPASAICIFFLLQRVELRAGTSHLSPRDVCKSSCGTNKQKKNERRSSETPPSPPRPASPPPPSSADEQSAGLIQRVWSSKPPHQSVAFVPLPPPHLISDFRSRLQV